MASLDLVAVMDGIAEKLRAIDTLAGERTYEWPTLTVNPPCAVVGYPTELNYDATFRRGSDRATFPAWIICGRVDARTTRDAIAAYVGPDGAKQFKEALEVEDPDDPWASLRVMGATVEAVNISGVDYQSVRFDLDILT